MLSPLASNIMTLIKGLPASSLTPFYTLVVVTRSLGGHMEHSFDLPFLGNHFLT